MGSEGHLVTIIHVTGFKKFQGVEENPTEAIVNNLQDYMNRNGMPRGLVLGSCTVLETAGYGALECLHKTLNSAFSSADCHSSNSRRVVWLHFGVNSLAKCFIIEQQAVNEASFRCSDQMGWKPQKVPIIQSDGGISYARKTSLPIRAIENALSNEGYEVTCSTDAGRFVCNYVYYHSLHFAEVNQTRSLFVHVPLFSTIEFDVQMKFSASLLEVISSLVW